ncbi:MAG: dipeptide ABC transporter ATP-binding protein [Deltaproteobacteria bacterium]|nr:dipeptide ABC transporter ATP-binding protein [Deltaproteobacteria bacterium]MBW2122379.1 dipeptide ABC transporter ATP-binding protein [Deltaproteobacteria bacterium]
MNTALLEVRGLKKYFPIRSGLLSRVSGYVFAVDGVDLVIHRGETLGLVGESGCGKSTLGRAILRLTEPTAGEVLFEGTSVLGLDKEALKGMRRNFQIIFQDPFSSLNPRMTVEEIVGDALTIHGIRDKNEREERVAAILRKVGLRREHLKRYPHEFSGGQRQRIGIARALVLEPKLLVCDEPLSALDVSIQAQIINMLMDLQQSMNLSYLFIAHDLSVVEHISTRVAVMYLGKIVELAEKRDLYASPRHPYTQALLSAVPVANPRVKPRRIMLHGDVPTPIAPPPGCRFHPRCGSRMEVCAREEPRLREISRDHFVACHRG